MPTRFKVADRDHTRGFIIPCGLALSITYQRALHCCSNTEYIFLLLLMG